MPSLTQCIPTPVRRGAKELLRSYCSVVVSTRKPFEYIFVLSHQRSGSSLLTHLLLSNPEICGYGETHTVYSTPEDLDLLVCKVMFRLGRLIRVGKERYVVDKLLHDRLVAPGHLEVLLPANTPVIFLIREPVGTLTSLMRHLGHEEQEAAAYYTGRLAMLDRYVSEVAHHRTCMAMTYDQLLNQTPQVFEMMERLLGLCHPLSEEYEILPTTGKRIIGDSSPSILEGRILRKRKPVDTLCISPGALHQATQAFERCRSSLTERCSSVPASDPGD